LGSNWGLGGPVAIVSAARHMNVAVIGVVSPPFSFDPFFAEGFPKNMIYNEKTGRLLFEGTLLPKAFIDQMRDLNMRVILQKLEHIPFSYINGGKDGIIHSIHD